MIDEDCPYCSKCGVIMEKQEYKRPYITSRGRFLGSILNVFICPSCGSEKEILLNKEDGYSAGAGLLSED